MASVRTFTCEKDLVNFFNKYALFATTGVWWAHIVALVPINIMFSRDEETVSGHCVAVYREPEPGNESCLVHLRIVNQVVARHSDQVLLDNEGSKHSKKWCPVNDIGHWLAVQLEVFDLSDAFGPMDEDDLDVGAGDE